MGGFMFRFRAVCCHRRLDRSGNQPRHYPRRGPRRADAQAADDLRSLCRLKETDPADIFAYPRTVPALQ